MKILIVQTGSWGECFISTSVIKGLLKKFTSPEIDVLVAKKTHKKIFAYNKSVHNVLSLDEHLDTKSLPEYDLVICMSLGFSAYEKLFKANSFEGFGYSATTDECAKTLYGSKKTSQNLFQIYYRLAGLSWKGEGYDIAYYPKSRVDKKKTGIAVANANLRNYIIDRLQLEASKIWRIPYKKDLFKRMDEINKVQHIVTDDFMSMHLAIALRKYVYFLEIVPCTTKIEFFGKGELVSVPSDILRWA